MTSRTFTASLKPALTTAQIDSLGSQLKGLATFLAITHDKDINEETGELVEPHTHLYFEYSTPRKITTIANLLNIETNFIEIVRNKKMFVRYLTHLDNPEKAQYPPFEVYTNNGLTYSQMIMGGQMTNTEILEFVYQGRTLDLIDSVPTYKLAAIQRLAHYESNNRLSKQVNAIAEQLEELTKLTTGVYEMANKFVNIVNPTIESLTEGYKEIANAIKEGTRAIQVKRAMNKR